MPGQMEPGQQLLVKLFQAWEQNPGSSRRKSLPINKGRAAAYFETISPEDKDNLHACLVNAEKAGCVELVWGKHHDNHLLKKIWLLDGKGLGKFLNLTLAKDLVSEARKEIEAIFPVPDAWIQRLFERVYAKWGKNQSAQRINPSDTDSLILLAKALIAVQNNKHAELDLRTFSAKNLGDSKALERMRERFAAVWNEEFSTGMDAQELYEYLGLVKFPMPIFIKGPIKVRTGSHWMPVDQAYPYLGIVPDAIEEITPTTTPDYILTIENLASFNRHCREIEDNGIILYTAGFMGPQSSRIVRLLDALCEESVPFFHWGDIDIGGLNISAHIYSQIKKQASLHLMTEDLLLKYGKTPERQMQKRPSKAIAPYPDLVSLKDKILATGLILEQENIDPLAPLPPIAEGTRQPQRNQHLVPH
ncbi:MAG: DUF2220 family protein [Desulfuromonadaceae bacterium]|nr:DUF2220 family protein [Desulfuromonas sp.]MDY0185137.1 DUF2220 family protein [Desulfuromonadaceae bacterium]